MCTFKSRRGLLSIRSKAFRQNWIFESKRVKFKAYSFFDNILMDQKTKHPIFKLINTNNIFDDLKSEKNPNSFFIINCPRSFGHPQVFEAFF